MNFITFNFYIFLILTIAFYFITPPKHRWLILLLSSLTFYAISSVETMLIMVGSALLAYASTLSMEKKADKKKSRFLLSVAIIVLLGMLAVVKVARFVPDEWIFDMWMPLGISYYTFSIIAYLADVYWKKQKAETSFLRFLLFVCYFPKILQGPIVRYKNLGPQLLEEHVFDYERVCFGLQLFFWGLFKKLVIADRLAIFVNEVYQNYDKYSGAFLLLATFLGAIQLYCDFSGCMDMASGMSSVFGIELEKNFNRPFFSQSAAEFWRRWHITLGTWFKDYVYMPLVISPKLIKFAQIFRKRFGARAGKNMMAIIPLAVVWLLTGIWHGTGMSYVAWGVYWGTIIILTTVFAPEITKLTKKLNIDTKSMSWEVFRMIRTFLIFCGGRLLTMPNDLRASVHILKRMVFDFNIGTLFDHSILDLELNIYNWILVILAILLVWYVECQEEKGIVMRKKIARYNIVFRWTLYYALIFSIVIFGIYGPGYDASSFVYMNF